MAHKTFISYKYSEAQDTRDAIIEALGDDASYYQGETADSPDMSDLSTETIKLKLRDMIFDTSVTIVVLSPHMTESKWIDWEIEFSLKNTSRDGRTSHTNGVVAVIQKVDGGYSWLETSKYNPDGHTTTYHDSGKLYPIINNNRFNQTPKVYACDHCKSVDYMNGSYIAIIKEEDFLNNPAKYIDNAFDKSQIATSGYILSKHR